MLRPAVLLAVLLLAGCASNAPAPDATYPPTPTTRPFDPQNPLWPPGEARPWTLVDAMFALDGAAPTWTTNVTIPNGTTRVFVNMSFLDGAGVGFSMRLAGCAFDVPGPVPGDGRTVAKDCGGLYEGNETLVLSASGRLGGRVTVVADVCPGPYASCHRVP